MAKVAVIGAGLGGIPMAYELRHTLGDEHEIILIGKGDKFNFIPSNPWVLVGWKQRSDIEFSITEYLTEFNITFYSSGAKKLHPNDNVVELNDGKKVDYDFLVIATGPRLAFEEVEGLGPDKFSHSVCTLDHAAQGFLAWNAYLENPGPIVVGATQGASCFGPAYETILIIDTELRKKGIRDNIPLTFITAEPYLGHIGLGGVGESTRILTEAFKNAGITAITNATVKKVTDWGVFVDELNTDGTVKSSHEIKSSYNVIIPAFKGIDAFSGIDGLINPRGFILVDEYQCNPTFPNIYAVGVCVAIAPVEATVVPTGAPKTGFMIESMVNATAQNIAAVLQGEKNYSKPTLNAVCFADFGDNGAAFIAIPQFKPRTHDWFFEGKLVHYAKLAFEKYYIHKIKSGKPEPFYEKFIMKMLGIVKTKKD